MIGVCSGNHESECHSPACATWWSTHWIFAFDECSFRNFRLSRWVIFSFLCGLIRAFPFKMLQFYVPSVVNFGVISICLGLQPFNSSENEEKETIHVSLELASLKFLSHRKTPCRAQTIKGVHQFSEEATSLPCLSWVARSTAMSIACCREKVPSPMQMLSNQELRPLATCEKAVRFWSSVLVA